MIIYNKKNRGYRVIKENKVNRNQLINMISKEIVFKIAF